MMSYQSILVVMLGLAAIATGYKEAPPVSGHPEICDNMTPQHGVDAQTDNAPYMVAANSACYKEKGIVTVSITNESLIWYYEGFLMAVKEDGKTCPSYGKFKVPSMYASSAQTLNCFGNSASAVGHKDGIHFYEHSLTWTAPCDVTDDLVISVTMVKNEELFWLDVDKSDLKLEYDADCNIPVDTTCPAAPKTDECSGAVIMHPHAMAVIIMALGALSWAKLL